ncbi:DUF4134 family protein [Mucilaginibacter phyllosphaerae]
MKLTIFLVQPGLDEFQQAQNEFHSSFFSALSFALVLAAILGIIGGIRIYHNWQMGEREMTSEVSGWFFAALFMVLAGIFIRAVFGL